MHNKKQLFLCVLFFLARLCFAQNNDGLGQIIQIQTNLHSFVGKPTWLIEIEDLDHGQVVPYLYDIEKGDNYWLAFTYGQNFRIKASNLQFGPYRFKINNFCHIQSGVISGKSVRIYLSGDLTPNRNTSSCTAIQYPDTNFVVTNAFAN